MMKKSITSFLFLMTVASSCCAFSLKNSSNEVFSLALERKGNEKYEVVTKIETEKTAFQPYERSAGGKVTDQIEKVILFKGEAGKGNDLPVASFGKSDLPTGGVEFGIPKDADYVIKKDKEGTFVLYGAPVKGRVFTRYRKVIKENETFVFEKTVSFRVRNENDSE